MAQPVEALIRFAAETRWEEIPEAVRDHAKLVLLDTLGVILVGSSQPEVDALRARLASGEAGGATVYARGFPRGDPNTAALLNGTAGRSVELCEVHRFVSCQAAVQVLPAVLAVGEAAGSTGREALGAFVLGYELAARVGAGRIGRPLAHQNGQHPMLGAILAGARLRRFDAALASRAVRIGATLMLTPSYTSVTAGATALNVAGGMSGFAGSLVPELALSGFEAEAGAVERAFGDLVGDGFDPERVVDQLGERWEITRNQFRLRACCSPIYPALDALEEALAELRPAPEDIERIDVATFQFASVMNNPRPGNYFAARYSLPHAAAAIVIRGDAGHESFGEAALRDPTIAALRERVHVAEDPALTALAPRLKPARVTVTLRDGRGVKRSCDSPRGDFQRPYEEGEIRAKFRELAAYVLTPEGVVAVESLMDRLDDVISVAELPDLMRRHSR